MASYASSAPSGGGNGHTGGRGGGHSGGHGAPGDGHRAEAILGQHDHGHAGGGGASDFHTHHPPAILYWKIFGVLMGLLLLTVVAYFFDVNPIFNIIFAMVIAITKAALVVLFFMNVKGSTRLTWLWAGLGFVWLLIMAGVFLDYQSRPGVPGWQ